MVVELVRHVLREPATQKLAELGEAGMPLPVGGGGGRGRDLALLDAVLDVVREAVQPLLDLAFGQPDVRDRVELAQAQPESAGRMVGVLAQLPLGDSQGPRAAVPGLPQVRGQGRAGLVRGVVRRLTGVGTHHLVQLAVAAVVFKRAQRHADQPLRVSTGRWGTWRGRRNHADGTRPASGSPGPRGRPPAPGRQASSPATAPGPPARAARARTPRWSDGDGWTGPARVDHLFIGGDDLLSGPLGGFAVGIGGGTERVSMVRTPLRSERSLWKERRQARANPKSSGTDAAHACGR
ncbi:hypothetical protein QFZ76_007250 [Streptomyces sp. V4I2]|nr:hypothetical protein [Streptomyces sp. V4I2]